MGESLNKADDLLLDLRKQTVEMAIVPPTEHIKLLSNRYAKLYEADGGIAIKTGLRDLDRELGGGFYGGDLIVIGGSFADSYWGNPKSIENTSLYISTHPWLSPLISFDLLSQKTNVTYKLNPIPSVYDYYPHPATDIYGAVVHRVAGL